ncbi:MAG: hypothetical protein EXR79_13130 [Myxococcales bacterium]|nr:hypothetical protein [Myxococcales bacterium]
MARFIAPHPLVCCTRLTTLAVLLVSAPAAAAAPPVSAATQPLATPPPTGPGPFCLNVPRAAFNRGAVALDLPIFWIADADNDGKLGPAELVVLWRAGEPAGQWKRADDGKGSAAAFGPDFQRACDDPRWLAVDANAKAVLSPESKRQAALSPESKRQAALRRELDQGRPTVVLTDLSQASAVDRAFVGHMLQAAGLVERLHARQNGVLGVADRIGGDDMLSRAVFRRNQGPQCEAPATERDKDCSALPERPARTSGLYPAKLLTDKKFCDKLAERKDGAELLHQFHVVIEARNGEPSAVPYHEAFKDDMQAVAQALQAAIAAQTDPKEEALRTYLRAAAKAFRDDTWFQADEAWAKMNADNSRWYLRIGPDETYFEPCSRKAGFHVSFARIDPSALHWQRLLDPLKNEMEQAIAALAGPPYAARTVAFHLPDFIHIVVNAGDSRSALGATVGQSLPNWGPVANEGRGRTVAMTNLYTDADSRLALRGQAQSLFCPQAMETFVDAVGPQVMSTVLHEAAHNLGPAHEYQAFGKTDDAAFGGPLASTLEELKAQTAALWLTDWLEQKGKLTDVERRRAHTADFAWAMGHISNGMWSKEGKPKPYSQLAAIQIGFLRREKAMIWFEEAAANGKDFGCFEIRHEAMPAALEKLMRLVAGIKARGDRKGAEALVAAFVKGGDATWKKVRDKVIVERWQRVPKSAFVYGVEGL